MANGEKGAAAPRRQLLRQGVSSPYMGLSVEETAAIAGIATSSLYALISAKSGPTVTKIGNRSVVLLCDFETWMEGLRPKKAA